MRTGRRADGARTHHALLALLWLGVAAQWLVAWLVPWTSRGLLSASSLADGARLVRSGSVSALVPTWAAWLLVVGPACALVLLGSATRDGSLVTAARCATVVVMAAAFAAGFYGLARLDATRVGPGGWLTLGGVALGAAGLAAQWRATRNRDGGEVDHE